MNTNKKPEFKRQDSHKKPRLKHKWRTGRGLHSKIRLAKMGYRKVPKTGYGADRSLKGMTSEKIMPVEILRKEDLKSIKKGEGAVIRKVGLKNKIEIIKEAIRLNIKIINVKDAQSFLKETEESLKKNKEEKAKEKAKKEGKKAEAKKKAEENAKKEAKENQAEKSESDINEEKKIIEKEKNKILTGKQQ